MRKSFGVTNGSHYKLGLKSRTTQMYKKQLNVSEEFVLNKCGSEFRELNGKGMFQTLEKKTHTEEHKFVPLCRVVIKIIHVRTEHFNVHYITNVLGTYKETMTSKITKLNMSTL